MNCCINCFESNYINSVILNNRMTGDCDYCESKNVSIYEASQLILFFKGIIDLYSINLNEGKSLEKQIISDFPKKVFSQKLIDANSVKAIIAEIIKDEIDKYQDILIQPVELRYHKTNIEEDIKRNLFLSWDRFTKEIKTINRFHLKNSLDIERLKSLFKHFVKEIPKGRKYYRARISENSKGFSIEKMGNPPNELAKGGRANPNGISYLYLSNNITTTVHEVRASLFDYVTVASFRLEENINVINLSRLTYDVFRLAEIESLEEVMIHGSFIDKLEQELSKPRRRSDSDLDYIPTQYISELIKSMGYDGIEFKSSLYENGVNTAIFNPEKFKCLDAKVYDITSTELEFKKLDD